MRRRRNQHGPWVLVSALVVSSGLHLAIGLPLRDMLSTLLKSSKAKDAPREPVQVVRLTPEAFQNSLERARQLVPRSRRDPDKPKAERAKKKEREQETDINGQIVEVPASNDKRRPDNARFLAKENSRVERETVARRDLRDERKRRVTNKLQDSAARRQPRKGIPVPGVSAEGDGGEDSKPAAKGSKAKQQRRFRLQMPRLARRDGVNLDLADLPELSSNRVWNRESRDEFPGNSDRLDVGGDPRPSPGDDEEESAGSKGGRQGLPSLQDLRPTLGTVARISGSPSDDYIENVPEGEGTFLNTRSFKYATFFYQIRDSVGAHWKSDVRREIRRRDPTGDIYGPGDLKTLLFIRLDGTGRLSEVRVAESSGYEFLDAVAVQAFEKAEQFPNPPKGIVDADGHINFHFGFVLYTGRRGPLNLFR